MTEGEWLSTKRPTRLEEHVRRAKLSNRKHLLLAAGCCRLLGKRISDSRSWIAIETAEQVLDEPLECWPDTAASARQDAYEAHVSFAEPNWFRSASWLPVGLLDAVEAGQRWQRGGNQAAGALVQNIMLTARDVEDGLDDNLAWRRYLNPNLPNERTHHPAQAHLLHDIFGNPFRPVAFDPAWRTSTAVGLAEGMYAGRDFAAMPILADALQDAGCEHADILDHCRGDGQHVRGCWVVDLVLGKQ